MAVESTEPTEDYYVDLFAVKNPKAPKDQVHLGRIGVVPVSKGQIPPIYTDVPLSKAWIRRDGNEQILLGWKILPGAVPRPVPKVRLRIDKVIALPK
jgi:hypothetical protein